ncbi:putative amidase-like protein [Kribbella voronezhensis]|uniref:Putative amidase-like protein n=1 Tax=Kribbella voronezhensis TaxID=2512212 RepID=A0A4R7TDL1_9ACTN|nr:amidase domain-containing protein [Kribbella voronezhensis]TDU90175.1 putative amidase-like protein [Kribbella voronezhensis]
MKLGIIGGRGRAMLVGASAAAMVVSGLGVQTAAGERAPSTLDAAVTSTEKTELLVLAKNYLTDRTSRVVSDGRGRAVASKNLSSDRLSVSLRQKVQGTDGVLESNRINLAKHGQRWIASQTTVTPISFERSGPGTIVAKVREYTRLEFDRKLDPEAPPATEQSVDRTFTFDEAGGQWQIVKTVADGQGTLVNDVPPTQNPLPTIMSPNISTPEYNYGTSTLSAADQAEDATPEPDPGLLPADAPEDGLPSSEPPKTDGSSGLTQQLTASYCYSCMVNYANTYWQNYNPNYRKWATDCTNFVSQALKSGGWAYDYGWYTSGSNWWYNSIHQTYTWSAAENFSHFAPKRTARLSSVYYLLASDVLLADWTGDNHIDHAMFVTLKTTGNIYLTYHTNNVHNMPLTWIIRDNRGAKYYAYRT